MKRLLSPEPNRLLPLPRAAGALAVGLAVGLASLLLACGGDGGEAATGGAPLAEGELRCVSPVGPAADFSSFEWEGELPEGGYFQVAVYIHNDGAPLGPVRRSPELDTNSWKPRADDVEKFPDEMFWRVFAVGSNRTTVARGKAVATR